jgi:hypothetical protein
MLYSDEADLRVAFEIFDANHGITNIYHDLNDLLTDRLIDMILYDRWPNHIGRV